MTHPTISTQEEALALANVVNPGGHRIGDDGLITPGLPLHETNCAIVAIATAAFLQDGTEASAFSAPSSLMVRINATMVRFVVSRNENEELEQYFPASQFQEKLAQLRERFPGCTFLAHGSNEDYHHWFNVTVDGIAFDAQMGLLNESVALGQPAFDGLREYTEMQLLPVNPSLSGAQLLKDAQDLHQMSAMVSLALRLAEDAGKEFVIPVWQTFDRIIDEHVAEQAMYGRADSGEVQNEKTGEAFNEVCMDIASAWGEDFVIESLVDKLVESKGKVTEKGSPQMWLTDAQFREPGSTEPGPRVIDVFRGQCPMLDIAMKVIERYETRPAQRDDGAIDR